MAEPSAPPDDPGRGRRQLAFDFSHRPSVSGEDFIVAPPNQAAVAWVDSWPDWPAPALVVYGPPGCGKSHLASVWQAQAGARRVMLPLPESSDPLQALGDASAVVIEDVERWIGAADAQRQLFHLYNMMAERRGHMMLTARQAPAQWPMTLADLRSRMAAAPAVAIEPPDEDLVAALLLKLFADRQLKVGDEVLTFLLARMDRSFDAARRLVAALDDAALHARRNVTVPLASEVLREVGPDGRRGARQGPDGRDRDKN
jgi:DnaA regulatory inactivator Hda